MNRSPVRTEDLIALYRRGHGLRRIARDTGLCHCTVRLRLRAAGVPTRPPGRPARPAAGR